MNYLEEIAGSKKTQEELGRFLENYGLSGLDQALKYYSDMQQDYICKTKTSISRIKIYDINYLRIHGHTISVHTNHGIYQKYGTISNELRFLASYDFIKCNQSCIVSVRKIKTIYNNNIILTNNEHLHMSRNYASKLLIKFNHISHTVLTV